MQTWTDTGYFPPASPEDVGITSASLLNFLDTVRQRELNLHSFMLIRHGKAAAAMWWRPYSPSQPHQLYSFSKSVTAAAVAMAQEEGRLSFEDRVAGFFPRQIDPDADERIFSVTVEHLLTMTSGAVAQNEVTMRGQDDWVEWFLNTPLNCEPGTRFAYNSLNTYMLAAILRKVTGEGLVDYLMPRLFEPLGIERPVWDTCPLGIECGGWGLYLTTGDMAKFCKLCLDDGLWEGRRLLPEGWASKAGSPLADTAADAKLNDSVHRTGGYGYQFWRNGDGSSWRADGMFGQYGLIMPEQDMVVVITGGHASQMEIMDAFYDTVVPYIDLIPEGSAPGTDWDELLGIAGELCCPRPERRPRSFEQEKRLDGMIFDFPMNSHSLLPLSMRYLHRIRNLGVSALRLEFGEEQSAIYWSEGGREQRVPFRTDGEFCRGTLTCAHREYPVVTAAGWTGPDTLTVDVRPIRTAHMNRVILRFEENRVICSFEEDPTVEKMLKMLFGLSPHARPVADRMARLAVRIRPSLVGRVRRERSLKGDIL